MNTLMMSVMDLECSTFAMCVCIFVSRICELGEEVTIVSCVLKFVE